jgi:hypothetical protein
VGGIDIPEELGALRKFPRPEHLRQPGYESAFDQTTLLYEAVHLVDTDEVVIVAPPALNLEEIWNKVRFSLPGSSEVLEKRLENLDGTLRVILGPIPPEATELKLSWPEVDVKLEIQKSNTVCFANRKVLYTQSQNNELAWIRDWVEFHVKIHGVDAVLIFDNASSIYQTQQIADLLGEIEGLRAFQVVSWPHKYGARAHQGSAWDSDFGQYGALEVARFLYLREANWILNLDVDELLVPESETSLSRFMDSSDQVAVGFGKVNTFRVTGNPAERSIDVGKRRHRQSTYSDFRNATTKTYKWCVRPSPTSLVRQFKVHQLAGLNEQEVFVDEFMIRHFIEVNTSWAHDRSKARPTSEGLVKDSNLIKALEESRFRGATR